MTNGSLCVHIRGWAPTACWPRQDHVDAMEQPPRAQSAASRKAKTARTKTFLAKQCISTPLPYNIVEKEVTLQHLVDSGMLTQEAAAADAVQHAAAAGGGEGGMPDAGAPAAPPDLTIKVQLFSEFGMVDKAKTEDWRLRGPLIKSTLVRPKVPVLFALPAMVEAGTIGKAMAKRPPPLSSHEQQKVIRLS